MKEFSRSQRVAEQLQREIAQIVQREVKDPRIGFVTISDVDVSKDFAHAQVFFTLLQNSDEQRLAAQEALNNMAGFIRHLLGKSLRMRVIPQLHFHYDKSIENGATLNELIIKANADNGSDGE